MIAPLDWILHTPGGLLARILIGTSIFVTLALTDLRRHGAAATRWREYGVLLIAVATALLYGAINDQITVTISPEYFIYGKELYKTIGENPPMNQLRLQAAKVGLEATWTVGLIFGVVLLLANNPIGLLPRLRNRQLVQLLPIIPLTAAACGIVGGLLGYHGYLTHFDSDFEAMVQANLFRPYRFMSTWGVHLGGYVGGLIGTIITVIFTLRHRMKNIQQPVKQIWFASNAWQRR